MTRKPAAPAPKAEPPLPPPLEAADLAFPADLLRLAEAAALGLPDAFLRLYHTERFGWVLCTLPIAAARRGRAETERTYGIALRGEELVTVGRGPHVTREVTAHLSRGNAERLRPLCELYLRGLAKAGDCRDRRSTRAAQTRARNAARDPFSPWLS
jgi:hypothetical protein